MTREQVRLFIQKPLLTSGIWTRDLWFRSLDLRPLDQPVMSLPICPYFTKSLFCHVSGWSVGLSYRWEHVRAMGIFQSTEKLEKLICHQILQKWPYLYFVFSPTNPHGPPWPFSLCVIHKDNLCPSIGDINGLMVIIFVPKTTNKVTITIAVYC
jgi:hypothetical protein